MLSRGSRWNVRSGLSESLSFVQRDRPFDIDGGTLGLRESKSHPSQAEAVPRRAPKPPSPPRRTLRFDPQNGHPEALELVHKAVHICRQTRTDRRYCLASGGGKRALARNAGVEPATSGFVDRRSIQLS